jgi:uncharacterized lipoprotein YddW (UPF0748 family)
MNTENKKSKEMPVVDPNKNYDIDGVSFDDYEVVVSGENPDSATNRAKKVEAESKQHQEKKNWTTKVVDFFK